MFTLIDLFAGCGGMSTGFEMAGFHIALAVEKDEWASATYKLNHAGTMVLTDDLTQLTDLNGLLPQTTVDGIIGGPPCQGFSLSGNRDPKDPRNSLFEKFVDFVRHFQPKFFVMENVKGILSMKTGSGQKVKDVILQEFDSAGYTTHIYVLDAAEFGVPQHRIRVFFIGLRKDIPYDERRMQPHGFLFGDDQITVEQAIMDLPQIEAGEGAEEQPYPCPPSNSYQQWVRQGCTSVRNHVAMKHSRRLVERFSHIGFGGSVADVDEQFGQRQRGNAAVVSGKVYAQNNMRPFPNQPSPTVPASFQSNFVHPYANRNYTAREGARLQSFPDSYVFCGKRTTMSWEKHLSQYHQIGNAVPPLLAKGIAETVVRYFTEQEARHE